MRLPLAVVLALGVALLPCDGSAQSAPRAAWGFEEGAGTVAADSSGNGNAGTVTGAMWATGRIGSALQFDGSNDHVSASDSESLRTASSITLSAWIKLFAQPTYQPIVAKMQTATGGLTYALVFDSGSLKAFVTV